MSLLVRVKDEIYEKESYEISFDVMDRTGSSPVNPSDVKMYIYLDSDTNTPPTYINGRDGTDITGRNIAANSVTWDLSPADNAIQGSDKYEVHIVLFEILYNADADRSWAMWLLKVKNLPVTS
jgi:hypothetical protein